jgi:hypothetical protein
MAKAIKVEKTIYVYEYLFVENLRALARPNDETFIASHKEIK